MNKFINDYGAMEADDIIQDVALNLFSKPDFDATVENAAAFVYRSLKNKIIDNYRKGKRTDSIDRNEKYNEMEDEKTNTQKSFENSEDLQKLNKAINRLNKDQKTIIIETEFEGKSFAELAELWNVPIGTLLSRKHRAMASLQKILNKGKK
ncbi:MAG: RNA polymerase sigma factor [Bacteroidetes bacterium]|nr:RNA polymerase sigma factor [Bacteroidota bacterium]